MTGTDDVMTGTDADTGTDTKVIDEAVIDEAVRLIDGGLSDLLHRELVSTDEVSDLLLDVRMLLMAADLASDAALAEDAPVGA